MESRTEAILIMTNPITYVLLLLALMFQMFYYIGKISGVNDWLFVWFKVKTLSPEAKNFMLNSYKKGLPKMFILRRMAWERLIEKLKTK